MKYRTAICDAADKALRLLHRVGIEYEEGTLDLCGWLLFVYVDIVGERGDPTKVVELVMQAYERARAYYENEEPPTRVVRRRLSDPNEN